MKSLCVKIFLTLVLLVGFAYGNVYAQDFSVWDGSLWKIKQTAKGVVFSNPDANEPPDGKARGTEQIWGIMTADVTGTNISIQFYEKGTGGACDPIDTIILTKQAGGPLGFVATVEKDVPDPFLSVRGLFYVSGKLKNATLQKGKITSLGGYILEAGWEDDVDLAAYGFNMSGTTVQGLGCTLP
jgi:hypothetical protein